MPRVVSFFANAAVTLSISKQLAWDAEMPFLKPNWEFENKLRRLKKEYKRLKTIFSKIFEKLGSRLIGL